MSTRLVPVLFVHMCCSPGAIAGQDANGDVYYRKLSWGHERPWQPIPPPLGAAIRRSVGVATARVKPAARRRRP